jgi:hypothetical protein
MSKRSDLLDSIAETIKDYRAGEIDPMSAKHVDRWVKQFGTEAQLPILFEMDHVLKKTYFNKKEVRETIADLVTNKALAGDDPCSFWKGIKFLDIQTAGNSQREMLAIFDAVLRKKCGFTIKDCGERPAAYIYLDDGIFTGHRIRTDMNGWIHSSAPKQAHVHVIATVLHSGGQWYAKTSIEKVAQEVGKEITMTWWRGIEVEDRKSYIDASDVLRPVNLPDDELTRAYAAKLRYEIKFRKPGDIGPGKFFSSEAGRHLLEQEFLKHGVKIRSESPLLNKYQRPLGNMVLETLGFGSMFVTYRNCPNNAPLALWAGNPWYPLFPRKTN